MFKSLLEIAKQLFGFANDTQESKENIKTLQTESADKADLIKQIIFELQRLKENEAHEREKLALRLQLALKDVEQRALPPGLSNQNTPELQAQIDALKEEFAERKAQLAALTASLNELKAAQEKANTAAK